MAVGIVEQDDELVPAEPEAHVRRVQAPLHLLRDGAQCTVAFPMAVYIVDFLEPVQIEHPHDQGRFFPVEAYQRVGKRGLPRPAVQKPGQFVVVRLLVQAEGIRNIHRLLQVYEGTVRPTHQAVAVVIDPPRQRVPLLPPKDLILIRVGHEPVHRAERAAPVHPGLQHLPADLPLGMFQLENILHEFIHIQDGVRVGIGDVQTDFHLIHRRVEHADMKRLLFAMCFSREEKPEHGAHKP